MTATDTGSFVIVGNARTPLGNVHRTLKTISATKLGAVAIKDSLGDRVCLALARRRGLPVLTTDKPWADLDLGIEVRLIR